MTARIRGAWIDALAAVDEHTLTPKGSQPSWWTIRISPPGCRLGVWLTGQGLARRRGRAVEVPYFGDRVAVDVVVAELVDSDVLTDIDQCEVIASDQPPRSFFAPTRRKRRRLTPHRVNRPASYPIAGRCAWPAAPGPGGR